MHEIFLALYNLVGTKGAKVAKVWENSGSYGAWNPRFLRPFNDWEMEVVQNFICSTNNNKIMPQKRDRILWKGDKTGHFTVKAYFSSRGWFFYFSTC